MAKEVAKLEGAPMNPYSMATESSKTQGPGTAMAQVESQRAMIEVMASFEVAKRFPRDNGIACNKILSECARPILAELAVYSYAKGGTDITGPTIRLMEAIARAWGNITFGWKVLESSPQKSTIYTYARDLETNALRDLTFDVRHWRSTKSGGYPLTDERDIYELQANMAQRRVRSCLEALFPREVIEMALAQCDLTSKSNIDLSAEGITKILGAFAKFGVNRAMIEARFQGLKMEALKPTHVVSLRNIRAGMVDGISKVDDWFDMSLADPKKEEEKPADQPKEEGAQPDLTKDIAGKKSETANAAAKSEKSETAPSTENAKSIVQQIEDAVRACKTNEDLAHVWDGEFKNDLDEMVDKDATAYNHLVNVMQDKQTQIKTGKLI